MSGVLRPSRAVSRSVLPAARSALPAERAGTWSALSSRPLQATEGVTPAYDSNERHVERCVSEVGQSRGADLSRCGWRLLRFEVWKLRPHSQNVLPLVLQSFRSPIQPCIESLTGRDHLEVFFRLPPCRRQKRKPKRNNRKQLQTSS